MATIAQERAELGYLLDSNEGEAFWLLGMLQTVKIGRDDTAGHYGLIEIVVPAGIGSPWHVHPEEDEWFYVLEGEMTVIVDGNETVLGPMDSCTITPDEVRKIENRSNNTCKMLVVIPYPPEA